MFAKVQYSMYFKFKSKFKGMIYLVIIGPKPKH